VRHFLDVEFVSCCENLNAGSPLGPAIVATVAVVVELARSLIIE
jgi:hypothetical protein